MSGYVCWVCKLGPCCESGYMDVGTLHGVCAASYLGYALDYMGHTGRLLFKGDIQRSSMAYMPHRVP